MMMRNLDEVDGVQSSLDKLVLCVKRKLRGKQVLYELFSYLQLIFLQLQLMNESLQVLFLNANLLVKCFPLSQTGFKVIELNCLFNLFQLYLKSLSLCVTSIISNKIQKKTYVKAILQRSMVSYFLGFSISVLYIMYLEGTNLELIKTQADGI